MTLELPHPCGLSPVPVLAVPLLSNPGVCPGTLQPGWPALSLPAVGSDWLRVPLPRGCFVWQRPL